MFKHRTNWEITADRIWREMVKVQGGAFRMGATHEQSGYAYANESPDHPVELDGFRIGRYPVTQAQWESLMDNNPSRYTGQSNLPVDSVSWEDAQEFIARLNTLTGGGYRLPTEAEWEYAARGGQSSKGYRYSGANRVEAVAWTLVNSKNKSHPVGRKRANELGLYDMSGNISEWCHDFFGEYDPSPVANPFGPIEGKQRVCRGGSWYYAPIAARVTFRQGVNADYRGRSRGFRLAFKD